MPPNKAETPHLRFPSRGAPDPEAAQRNLALLTNWQTGAAATTIVATGLLPFAIAWRVSYLIAIAASIILAALVAISAHIARRRRLATMALSPELVQLPDLESERQRLQSAQPPRAGRGAPTHSGPHPALSPPGPLPSPGRPRRSGARATARTRERPRTNANPRSCVRRSTTRAPDAWKQPPLQPQRPCRRPRHHPCPCARRTNHLSHLATRVRNCRRTHARAGRGRDHQGRRIEERTAIWPDHTSDSTSIRIASSVAATS